MSAAAGRRTAPDAEVAFHDAECGGYAADLGLWASLTAGAGGPVLDLGAGTGRVALPLAIAGRRVLALEYEPALAGELARRARAAGAPVEVLVRDARSIVPLPEPPAVALAPMQFMQLFDRPGRARVLDAVAAALPPGGSFAAALLDERLPLSSGEPDPLPDVREVDGWVHSSTPLEVRVEGEAIEVVRLRQVVSPAGELSSERHVTMLWRLDPEVLSAELAARGLEEARIEPIGETDDHVASVAVIARRAGG